MTPSPLNFESRHITQCLSQLPQFALRIYQNGRSKKGSLFIIYLWISSLNLFSTPIIILFPLSPNLQDGNPPIKGRNPPLTNQTNSCHLRLPFRTYTTLNSPKHNTVIWNKDQIHISSTSGLRLLPFHLFVHFTNPPKIIHLTSVVPKNPAIMAHIRLKDKPFSHLYLYTPRPKSITCKTILLALRSLPKCAHNI